ncbi:hypothetical protein Bca101_026856 [Brassica carinata]
MVYVTQERCYWEEYSAELSFVCCSSGTQYLEKLQWCKKLRIALIAVYGTTEELLEMSLTWTNLNWIREFYKGQSWNSTIRFYIAFVNCLQTSLK